MYVCVSLLLSYFQCCIRGEGSFHISVIQILVLSDHGVMHVGFGSSKEELFHSSHVGFSSSKEKFFH